MTTMSTFTISMAVTLFDLYEKILFEFFRYLKLIWHAVTCQHTEELQACQQSD